MWKEVNSVIKKKRFAGKLSQFQNQESSSDDSVELNIDREKETDPKPAEELGTKPSDIQNNVYSENENLDLKSKETFNKDEEDTKIGNTQSVTMNNEEVLDESRVKG
jgi:hypothetical protein